MTRPLQKPKMPGLHISVTATCIATRAIACWLARAGTYVTFIQQAYTPWAMGKVEGIHGADLDDFIRENVTKGEGLAFLDFPRASFPFDSGGKGKSFTSEAEILKGSLAMLYTTI